MITRARTKQFPKGRIRLVCNGRNCMETEIFGPSDDVAAWRRKNGWTATHRGGDLWDHHCPHCARLKLAPAAYWERLMAS